MSTILEPLTSYLEREAKSCSTVEIKSGLESYDCGDECSFARLVRVYELLEIEDQELDLRVFDDACLHAKTNQIPEPLFS